jgi:cytochrome c biogenesis protein CcdA/thiol-disulfide isomerase/thioredoxin
MRMDFKKLKEEKRAGAVLVALVIVGSLLAIGLVKYEASISNSYVSPNSYSIYNVPAFEKVLKENKYVAAMFRSLTCPHCERMMPYWLKLEMSKGKVKFVDVVYNSNTAELFQRYNIEGTPTFILFVNGKPVLRHEGEFLGSNVTQEMYSWAMQGVGENYIPGYETFVAHCSRCHGTPPSLTKDGLLSWLKADQATLGKLILAAYKHHETLSQYLGGMQAIEQKIVAMAQRNGVSFDPVTIKKTAEFLEGVSEVLLGKKPQIKQNVQSMDVLAKPTAAPLVMLLAGLAAGIGAAVSPCNFPLFITYITRSLREKKGGPAKALACALAAAVGVGILGALFLAFSTAALEVQKVLIPVVGAIIVAISLASLLKVPIELSAGKLGRMGGGTFCFVYGFLSVQCNLPLVIGALLLIAAGGGIFTLAGFVVGVAVPLFAAGWAGPRLRGVAEKLTRNAEKVEAFTSFLMLLAGIYLGFYGAGLL